MEIIAYIAQKQGSKVLLKASDGRETIIDNWSDLVTELLSPCDFAVVWNLDKFTETVCSLINAHVMESFDAKGRFILPDKTKFYYQPGRLFVVTYAGREVPYYGLSRYSDTETKDVNELLAFGQKVIEAYAEMGIKATKLTSPVALYPLDRVNYPRAGDLPESAIGMINATYKVQSREWRDVYKLGHWNADEISDYDLRAAYPSLLARLPDISKAKFFESDTLPERFSWGELYGELTIKKQVSPFVHESDNGDTFPVGTWQDSITTDELWLLKKYDIGEFQLEYGYFFTLPQDYSLPFNQTMANLYQARASPNPITSNIAKAISVGIGGKLQQRYDDGKLGTNFNSIYARMMTSRCMVKVADFIYRNGLQDDLVSVMVDGCLTTKRVELPCQNVMGKWRMNEQSPFLVASMLYQWGDSKHPDGRYYDEVIKDLQTHPQSSVYGDVDLNMIDYSRKFPRRPRSGEELLNTRFKSEAFTV
jgi:hypothetical protein